jgi:acyl-CoA synthetase (AMP-forming)/AMP-acid ligase II
VPPLATAQEFAKQLTDCAARWIITVSPLLDIARRAAELAGGVHEIFVCDSATGHRSLIDMLASAAPEPQVPIDPVEDVAVLPYSSGTTGTPKGVMLTHRQIATNLAQLHPAIPAGPGDRVLAVLPFFHIYGLTALMNAPLRQGATVAVLPRFDLEQFLAAIQNHRITALYVAPPIVLALAKHPAVAQYDLSSLKYIVRAAAPLDARLAVACSQRLGLPPVGQAYGMTELSPLTIAVPRVPNELATDREYSVTISDAFGPLRSRTSTAGLAGRQVCGAGVRLLGGTPPLALTGAATGVEAEKPIREGRAPSRSRWGKVNKYKGFLLMKARCTAAQRKPSRCRGYDKALRRSAPERHVVRHPKASTSPGGEGVMQVTERVAPYKRIRHVTFIDGVPRAASGKILRRQLRERA